MAVRFYDEAIYNKIQAWVKDSSMRILKPNETTRLFQLQADKKQDEPLSLPLIAISRDTSIEILQNKKHPMSFSGYPVGKSKAMTATLDAIPITVNYQIDIFTQKFEEADEYVRNFTFQIINNPKLTIMLPYNDAKLEHIAYIRLLPTLTDNSDLAMKLFPDQFTRWTLQIELQDAYLFSIPFSQNWNIEGADLILQEEKQISDSDIVEPVINDNET